MGANLSTPARLAQIANNLIQALPAASRQLAAAATRALLAIPNLGSYGLAIRSLATVIRTVSRIVMAHPLKAGVVALYGLWIMRAQYHRRYPVHHALGGPPDLQNLDGQLAEDSELVPYRARVATLSTPIVASGAATAPAPARRLRVKRPRSPSTSGSDTDVSSSASLSTGTSGASTPTSGSLSPDAGWRLARRCGFDVRAKLGQPARSRANQTIVAQRCASWIEENAPTLRRCYRPQVLARSIVIALTPTRFELEAADALNSSLVADREHRVHGPATIPMFRGFLGELLALFPTFRIPSRADF